MKTICSVFLLFSLRFLAQASPVNLRGSGSRKSKIEEKLPVSTTTHAARRLTDTDPWEAYSQNAEQASAGVSLFSDSLSLVKEPSWESAGATMSSLGALAAVAVPPPMGLAAGAFLGVGGAIMSIFGGDSGPSNQDIMDAMNEGFDNMEKLMKKGFEQIGGMISDVGYDVRHVSVQIEALQADVDRLAGLTSDIYAWTVLQGGRIKLFTQKVAELSRRQESCLVDAEMVTYYKTYLYELADEFADMQGAVGGTEPRQPRCNDWHHQADG